MSDNLKRDEKRRKMNNQSLAWARDPRRAWTDDEDLVILNEWILVRADLRDEMGIAKRLERSLFACTGRAESLRKVLDCTDPSHTVSHAPNEKPYIGALDDDEDRWWE